MGGLQQAKNYINWVGRRKVMTTLVVEEWCKGTPFDATILTKALYNNIRYNNGVEGLVASFTWRRLTCMSFFLDFRGW